MQLLDAQPHALCVSECSGLLEMHVKAHVQYCSFFGTKGKGKESSRKRQRERRGKRKREQDRESVCVFMCLSVSPFVFLSDFVPFCLNTPSNNELELE